MPNYKNKIKTLTSESLNLQLTKKYHNLVHRLKKRTVTPGLPTVTMFSKKQSNPTIWEPIRSGPRRGRTGRRCKSFSVPNTGERDGSLTRRCPAPLIWPTLQSACSACSWSRMTTPVCNCKLFIANCSSNYRRTFNLGDEQGKTPKEMPAVITGRWGMRLQRQNAYQVKTSLGARLMASAASWRNPTNKQERTLKLCSKCTGAAWKRSGVQSYERSPHHLQWKIRSGRGASPTAPPPSTPQKTNFMVRTLTGPTAGVFAATPTCLKNVCRQYGWGQHTPTMVIHAGEDWGEEDRIGNEWRGGRIDMESKKGRNLKRCRML